MKNYLIWKHCKTFFINNAFKNHHFFKINLNKKFKIIFSFPFYLKKGHVLILTCLEYQENVRDYFKNKSFYVNDLNRFFFYSLSLSFYLGGVFINDINLKKYKLRVSKINKFWLKSTQNSLILKISRLKVL